MVARRKREPSGLFWDRRGRVCCAKHTPYRGSDTWRFDGWRSIPKSQAVWEDGKPMTCESCDWQKRREAEAKVTEPTKVTEPIMRDAVIFKDEGDTGPVWVRRDDQVLNYQDGEMDFRGRPAPAWFTYDEARKIAERLGLPLEEV